MKTPFITCVSAIVSKDLRAEIRSRELLSVMGLFALLSVLVFSFALELDRQAREEAVSGVLWVTLIFASMLGLNRSMALERDQGSLDAMLAAPVSRAAIFVGKLLGNFLFTAVVGLGDAAVDDGSVWNEFTEWLGGRHDRGGHIRLRHDWDAAGDDDGPDARPRGFTADCHAADRLALSLDGCARHEGYS